MKKYLLFTGVFLVAFVILQVLSGWVLTLFYTPNWMRPQLYPLKLILEMQVLFLHWLSCS
ncbi:hypothetical protein JOD43_001152 [Pullulanibacillus pueri]|uniref:hypothetical protein n=1 Tax=Pullulanibacillus pueri TaxID=1437324 RepID=UPI00166A86D2|nr:hypothetical protein [Pullulanibacillus pueri]MBM7680986.1 hypothetical protein [Pullulanibacillus pueri]